MNFHFINRSLIKMKRRLALGETKLDNKSTQTQKERLEMA